MLGIMAGMIQKQLTVKVGDIPVVAQRPFLMVLTAQQTTETPPLLVDMVVNAPVMQVVQVVRTSQVLVVKITVVIPQLQHVEKSCVDKVVHTPVVCNDRSSTSRS